MRHLRVLRWQPYIKALFFFFVACIAMEGNFCSNAQADPVESQANIACSGLSDPVSLPQLHVLVDQKNPEAMLCLGDLYDQGKGVTPDLQLAAQWIRQAAEAGSVPGMVRYAKMLSEGRGLLPDQARAALWFRQAAKRDNAEAQTRLGEAYEEGKGEAQDFKEAAAWYGRAVMHRQPDAMARLGRLFMEGKGVKKNSQQATILLFNAALLGNTDAPDWLALLNKAEETAADEAASEEAGTAAKAGQGKKNTASKPEKTDKTGRAGKNGKAAATENRSNLFGLALDKADRAMVRAAMSRNAAPVVREDDSFFCDVYQVDKVLPGAGQMAACFEPEGKRRLAMLKISYPTESKADMEKVMSTFDERLGPPSAIDGSTTRIWNFSPVMAVGQYVPMAVETSLMYLLPSVYAPLMHTARASELPVVQAGEGAQPSLAGPQSQAPKAAPIQKAGSLQKAGQAPKANQVK